MPTKIEGKSRRVAEKLVRILAEMEAYPTDPEDVLDEAERLVVSRKLNGSWPMKTGIVLSTGQLNEIIEIIGMMRVFFNK